MRLPSLTRGCRVRSPTDQHFSFLYFSFLYFSSLSLFYISLSSVAVLVLGWRRHHGTQFFQRTGSDQRGSGSDARCRVSKLSLELRLKLHWGGVRIRVSGSSNLAANPPQIKSCTAPPFPPRPCAHARRRTLICQFDPVPSVCSGLCLCISLDPDRASWLPAGSFDAPSVTETFYALADALFLYASAGVSGGEPSAGVIAGPRRGQEFSRSAAAWRLSGSPGGSFS